MYICLFYILARTDENERKKEKRRGGGGGAGSEIYILEYIMCPAEYIMCPVESPKCPAEYVYSLYEGVLHPNSFTFFSPPTPSSYFLFLLQSPLR